nr:PH domain-containing protein [uncultured Desulfobacter sp.]
MKDTPSSQSGFANYAKYEEFTRSKNWKGIFELNGLKIDSFGTKKELKVLPDYLEDDEVVFALASGIMSQTKTSNAFDWGANTWLVALTNERFLFLDHAMLTKSVDTQSVHHDAVQAVSASQGLMYGKIQVDLGARVIIIDNCQKAAVKVIADLANKWLREIKKKIHTQTSNPATGTNGSEQLQELINLSISQIKNQERIISLLEHIVEK